MNPTKGTIESQREEQIRNVVKLKQSGGVRRYL